MCAVQVGTGQDEPLEVWVVEDSGSQIEEKRTADRFLEEHPDVAALCNPDFTVNFLARLQQPDAMIWKIARDLGVNDSALRMYNDHCRGQIERVRRTERERIRAEAERLRAGAD